MAIATSRPFDNGRTRRDCGRQIAGSARHSVAYQEVTMQLHTLGRTLRLLPAVLLFEHLLAVSATAQSCGTKQVAVQVLGSGGPDLRDKRASSSYLVWKGGKALVLVDVGGGSAVRFGESGAEISQLEVVLLTHLHADHTSDLPALVLSSRFDGRSRPLPVFGPPAGDTFPSTTEFVSGLFATSRGAWRYLSGIVEGGHPYQLKPDDVGAGDSPVEVFRTDAMAIAAVRTDHGIAPALSWRVTIEGKRIVFSGDTAGQSEGLHRLAENADLLVAHNATSRFSDQATKSILMPPSVIGQIAADARVRRLVLSHRMAETLGRKHEEQTREDIRKRFSGPLEFANDLDCFVLR
jgi:ribonuclease BN (tRNA processing enzyme)